MGKTMASRRFSFLTGMAAALAAASAYARAPEGLVPYPVLKPQFNLVAPNFEQDLIKSVPRVYDRPDPPVQEGPEGTETQAAEGEEEGERGGVIYPSAKQFGLAPRKRAACPATPVTEPAYPAPKEINLTNNLWRKTGSFKHAAGQFIQLNGVVRDENCSPVLGAVVTIWQRDNAGMHEEEYRRLVEDLRMHPDYDRYFGYSGRTSSNNLGEFSFLSVMPGTAHPSRPPLINIDVHHEKYERLQTRIYLLPNIESSRDFSVHPANPFRNSGIEPLSDLPGVIASSDLEAEEKRYGFVFNVDLSLRTPEPDEGL
jgi:protocatechuate 3,4-dioxygenase beta subunit